MPPSVDTACHKLSGMQGCQTQPFDSQLNASSLREECQLMVVLHMTDDVYGIRSPHNLHREGIDFGSPTIYFTLYCTSSIGVLILAQVLNFTFGENIAAGGQQRGEMFNKKQIFRSSGHRMNPNRKSKLQANFEHNLAGKESTRRGGSDSNLIGGMHPSIARSEAKKASTSRGLMKRIRCFVCFTMDAPKELAPKNADNDGVLTKMVNLEKGSKRNARNYDEPVTCEACSVKMGKSSRKMVSNSAVQSHSNLRAESQDKLLERDSEGEAAKLQSDIQEREKTVRNEAAVHHYNDLRDESPWKQRDLKVESMKNLAGNEIREKPTGEIVTLSVESERPSESPKYQRGEQVEAVKQQSIEDRYVENLAENEKRKESSGEIVSLPVPSEIRTEPPTYRRGDDSKSQVLEPLRSPLRCVQEDMDPVLQEAALAICKKARTYEGRKQLSETATLKQFSPGLVSRLVQLLQEKESVDAREDAASALATLSKHLKTELAAAESLEALVGLLAEKESEVLKLFSVEVLSNITEDKKTRNMVCSYPGIINGLLKLLMVRRKNFHNQGPHEDPRVRALLVLKQLSKEDAFVEKMDRVPGSLKTIIDMLSDKALLVQNTASQILESLAASGTEHMLFRIADCAGALENIRRLLSTTDSNEEELRCCAARVLKLLAGHIGASLKILNCPELFSVLQSVKTDMKCSSEFRDVILLTLKELESSEEYF